MRRTLILLAALTGCTQYARTSTHNATPIVNLDVPPLHETGEPKQFTPGTEPGTETISVFVTPSILFGSGRYGGELLHVEPGVAFRIERLLDDGAAYLKPSAFAVTVGTGIATIVDQRPVTPAAVFAELNYRFPISVIPADIGLGPVLYPGAETFPTDIGGQLDVKITILEIRARYMPSTGFEIMAGYSIPIPFFFRRSR